MNIMTKRGSQDNVVTYEHYCDTKDDLTAIPNDQITLGSTAVVLKDDGDTMGVYMANSSKEWIPFSSVGNAGGGSSGGPTILADLTDVDISNPTDGQTLTYDATAGKWVNGGGGGSSGGVLEVHTSFDEQTDITSLDKTWLEIDNAMNDGTTVYIGNTFTDEYDGHEIAIVYKYRVNSVYVNPFAGELCVTTDCNDESGYSEFKCSGINDYPNDSHMQGQG